MAWDTTSASSLGREYMLATGCRTTPSVAPAASSAIVITICIPYHFLSFPGITPAPARRTSCISL
jgi:hypothetical protein